MGYKSKLDVGFISSRAKLGWRSSPGSSTIMSIVRGWRVSVDMITHAPITTGDLFK